MIWTSEHVTGFDPLALKDRTNLYECNKQYSSKE